MAYNRVLASIQVLAYNSARTVFLFEKPWSQKSGTILLIGTDVDFFHASYFIIVIKNRQEKIRRQHLSHLKLSLLFLPAAQLQAPNFPPKNFSEGTHPRRFFWGDLSSKKAAASLETIITYDVIFLLVSH